VLRLLEALVPSGEASAKDVAYLYDRVMLRLAGAQRYGSQMDCVKGSMQPQPLEDARQVDTFRHQVGLPPMREYLKLFPKEC
jgi:hypothetical protein